MAAHFVLESILAGVDKAIEVRTVREMCIMLTLVPDSIG